MGIGGITHTLNPRLSDSDISYIANHGEDKLILVDSTLLPVVARIAKDLPLLQAVVVLTDRCGTLGLFWLSSLGLALRSSWVRLFFVGSTSQKVATSQTVEANQTVP
jgi:hypothetical protein